MRRLTRVVSISRSTTRDLEGFAGVYGEKVDLVYNGADTARFLPGCPDVSRKRLLNAGFDLGNPYVLYVSRIEHPGKNHVGLLEAFKRSLPDLDPDLKLVFVGARWNGAEKVDEKIAELGLTDRVVFPGFVPNEALPDLYRAADLLAFPSLFEGFGIPALEAMASGTPVMVADNSSLPEVVGEAGFCFDPHNVQAMSDCLSCMANDEVLRERLAVKGLKQAAKFSWEHTATGVYQSFVEALAANQQPTFSARKPKNS